MARAEFRNVNTSLQGSLLLTQDEELAIIHGLNIWPFDVIDFKTRHEEDGKPQLDEPAFDPKVMVAANSQFKPFTIKCTNSIYRDRLKAGPTASTSLYSLIVMAEQEQTFTIESYLRGKVRNIDITDDAMMSALVDAQVEPGTVAMEATDKQKDLALASIFIWIAGSPTRSQSIEDADGRWSHKEGGEQMSALAANRYLAMANELRKKWGLTAVANWQRFP